MKTLDDTMTDGLLRAAAGGDPWALGRLLDRFRPRLRRAMARRLDDRLAVRVDASDIVQEALIDASAKLNDYLEQRPLPFYPWLKRLADERLIRARRRHVGCASRSVRREIRGVVARADASTISLADRLVSMGSSPSGQAVRAERREQAMRALARLEPVDREILVLRFVERYPFARIAERLGIGEGAARMRQLRALAHLRARLDEDLAERL